MREAALPPQLGLNEVLVRVRFSGLNFADIHIRAGLYVGAPAMPFVPGFELSGMVEAIGSHVTSVRVGDQVIAGTLYGGYTSRIVLPDWQVIALPSHLTLPQGAALPVAFVTAHVALQEMARIREGDRVLIDCATGGVGTVALQLCRDARCEVVGLTSTRSKLDHIARYGAQPLLREHYELDPSVADFDVILNSAGGRTVARDQGRLRPTGRVIALGASSLLKRGRPHLPSIVSFLASSFCPFAMQSLFAQSKGYFGLSVNGLFTREHLSGGLTSAIAQTRVTPFVDRVFRPSDIASAHEYLERGAARGKVLIAWDEP